MTADSRPRKHCTNASCSTHSITVRTEAGECVACGRDPYDETANFLNGIFGAGGFGDSLGFGPFGSKS